MPAHNQWDIWSVRWTYDDSSVHGRPALLISDAAYEAQHGHIVGAMISSKFHPVPNRVDLAANLGDPEFAQTGLRMTSHIYTANVQELSESNLLVQLGTLGPTAAELVRGMWS